MQKAITVCLFFITRGDLLNQMGRMLVQSCQKKKKRKEKQIKFLFKVVKSYCKNVMHQNSML